MRPPWDPANPTYDRPNQPWICGLTAEGRACPAGPTAAGRCPALAECAPVRDGDRWLCNRSELRGGPCETGPAPDGACGCVSHCAPVPSLRRIRGRFVLATTVATAAGLVMVLAANWRNEVIAPGPLAAQHAQLLRRAGAAPQCSACHAAADASLGEWVASLATGHGAGPTQSQLCMNCHDKSLDPRFALSPHNVPPDQLAQWTLAGRRRTRHRSDADRADDQKLACATCHREHHGADFDLTAMSDQACQTCHQRRFQSFATDHPDFGGWPYEASAAIAFNHAAHEAKHFREKNEAFDCRRCHVADRDGIGHLLTGYEASCASCHNDRIATSSARGVAVLALPTLDVQALRAAGSDIGPWPRAATGDFDGRLPPVMKGLLLSDPAAARALSTLGADFNFLEVELEKREHLTATAHLAIAIKKLLAELDESGPEAARARLWKLLGEQTAGHQLQYSFSGLSRDTLQQALGEWLGSESSTARPESSARDADKAQTPPAAGAWHYDGATLSIRYVPTGHADPVLKGWLSIFGGIQELQARPLERAVFAELTRATAPGLCTACHRVVQTPGSGLIPAWRAADRAAVPKGFTKFSHRPHLLLPELADCRACHSIDPDARLVNALEPADAVVRDFRPLAKQQCAECHTENAAGERCQSCHNYHVRRFEGLVRGAEDLKTLSRGNGFNSEVLQAGLAGENSLKTSNDTRPERR